MSAVLAMPVNAFAIAPFSFSISTRRASRLGNFQSGADKYGSEFPIRINAAHLAVRTIGI